MEKILNYTLSLLGHSPDESLCGGIQGEHRATALVFSTDDGLKSAIAQAEAKGHTVKICIDAITEAGEFIKGEEREASGLYDPFYLTAPMTASGLDIVVLVKFLLLDLNHKLMSELYRAQIKLWFEQSLTSATLPRHDKSKETELQSVAEELCRIIEEKGQAASELITVKAEQVIEGAKTSAEQLKKTLTAAQSAQAAATSAEENRIVAEDSARECSAISKQMTQGLIQLSQAKEKVTCAAENTQLLAEECEKSAAEIKNYADCLWSQIGESANSFKGKAYGSEILLTDISPITHRVKVKVEANGSTVEDIAITVTDSNGGQTVLKTDALGEAVFESTYPEMRITNSSGKFMVAEYNRDTAAVMGELETALDSITKIQQTFIGGAV